MSRIEMLGAVGGYSKNHYYLGTPEFREEKPKKKIVKKIRPKQRSSIQVIKPEK
jgi:hypothetical protein